MNHDELQQALKRGIEMALDPRNASARSVQDPRVTTIYSPWLLQICRICRHSFREDDVVLPDPSRPDRMLHDDPRSSLRCWRRAHGLPVEPVTRTSHNPAVYEAFMRGLGEHWQPAGDLQTEWVPLRSALTGRKCPICRHTVRSGDQVVRCPCGRNCGGVFHQDITRHLTCWNTWNRGAQRSYCAFTGAPFVSNQQETGS